jgi:hypothetical protein
MVLVWPESHSYRADALSVYENINGDWILVGGPDDPDGMLHKKWFQFQRHRLAVPILAGIATAAAILFFLTLLGKKDLSIRSIVSASGVATAAVFVADLCLPPDPARRMVGGDVATVLEYLAWVVVVILCVLTLTAVKSRMDKNRSL